MSGEIVRFPFQATDTPGGDDLFTTLRSEKNIWLLFDVDKIPGAPKNQISHSRTFQSFSAGDKHPQNLFRVEGDGLEVIAPSCEGMDVGGVIGSTVAERERIKESESVHPPSILPVSLSSLLSHSLQNH